MIDREELKELVSYRDDENLVISFYYPLEKGGPTEEGGIITLKNLISEAEAARGDWTGTQAKSVDVDLARIEQLAAEERLISKGGLAVFASSATGLWRVYRVSDNVAPLMVIDHSPRMRPLIELLDRHQRYCTVLVGKGRARLFLISPDTVEERSDVFGVVPGRHDQGGWAQARYQRHHDDHVVRHLKDIADQTFSLLQEEDFQKLFIAGTEELVSEFEEHLHSYLVDRLAGTFPMEMVASPTEVREQTLIAASELRDIHDRDALEKLRGEARTGNLGAAGLEDTLYALQKGQVLMLLVNEDFSAPGLQCSGCGSLCLTDPCPFCAGDTEPLEDIVESIIGQSFLQNSEVRIITSANKARLAEMGGIGALLRFSD